MSSVPTLADSIQNLRQWKNSGTGTREVFYAHGSMHPVNPSWASERMTLEQFAKHRNDTSGWYGFMRVCKK